MHRHIPRLVTKNMVKLAKDACTTVTHKCTQIIAEKTHTHTHTGKGEEISSVNCTMPGIWESHRYKIAMRTTMLASLQYSKILSSNQSTTQSQQPRHHMHTGHVARVHQMPAFFGCPEAQMQHLVLSASRLSKSMTYWDIQHLDAVLSGTLVWAHMCLGTHAQNAGVLRSWLTCLNVCNSNCE